MIAWENGELEADDEIALFADLVKSGLAWQLQGCYGRMAARMIEAGYISNQGEVLKHVED
jgi:hypothetical protein